MNLYDRRKAQSVYSIIKSWMEVLLIYLLKSSANHGTDATERMSSMSSMASHMMFKDVMMSKGVVTSWWDAVWRFCRLLRTLDLNLNQTVQIHKIGHVNMSSKKRYKFTTRPIPKHFLAVGNCTMLKWFLKLQLGSFRNTVLELLDWILSIPWFESWIKRCYSVDTDKSEASGISREGEEGVGGRGGRDKRGLYSPGFDKGIAKIATQHPLLCSVSYSLWLTLPLPAICTREKHSFDCHKILKSSKHDRYRCNWIALPAAKSLHLIDQ